mmetsp:Transcript_1031/g.3473  ORF Transcript_1031/g.3473 Transcript_1031/m.3473 type:complete len:520 (+) Transcript_1031:1403-2962(+)
MEWTVTTGTKKKRKKKRRSKALWSPASVLVDPTKGKLRVKAVQDACLAALHAPNHPIFRYPPGIRVTGGRIDRVVVLHVDGLDAALLIKHGAAWKELTARFTATHGAQMPGNASYVYDVGQTLLQRPLTTAARKRLLASATKKHFRELVLTADQMADHNYPSHREGVPEGWCTLDRAGDGTERMYAIDCEMVLTERGRELARCTVVDAVGATVYDELVQPSTPVIDYLTKFSGITPDLLEGITTRLNDVQKALQALLAKTDIIVGHSLENDLRALQLVHPLVVDTAICFGSSLPGTMKHGLKHLAHRCLGKQIRASPAVGHDSAEDARIAMELVQALLRDPASCKVFQDVTNPMATLLAQSKLKGLLLDPRRNTNYMRAQAAVADPAFISLPPCDGDDGVVEHFVASAQQHDFVWARLSGVSGRDPDAKAVAATAAAVSKILESVSPPTDDAAPPSNTLVFVIGSASHADFRELHRVKKAGGAWDDDQRDRLKEMVASAREGIVYTAVNPQRNLRKAFK